MGEEIQSSQFTASDFTEFKRRLRSETKILMDWFKTSQFEDGANRCGLELEAWIVDSEFNPTPKNSEFLEKLAEPLAVPELAKFNFELNSDPLLLGEKTLSQSYSALEGLWQKCCASGDSLDMRTAAIGILPTVTKGMLSLENVSGLRRYEALNQQVLDLRGGQPLHILVEGQDRLELHQNDVMLEAAATSLQVHLQVNQENAVRVFNASQLVSAPLVALAANSPFLFGKRLWDETRIAIFEQAVSVASFRDKLGDVIGRVTFGTGYCRESLFELFLENLDGYPPLLPILVEEKPESLKHLRIHNGTIWRWNRPIVGLDDAGTPHLRVEHRVMAAGPSMRDVVANMAIYIGLVQYYSDVKREWIFEMPHHRVKSNFYECAKNGLQAELNWFGKVWSIRDLYTQVLLPAAQQGLQQLGLSGDDISLYVDQVAGGRVASGQNGANWQKSFVDRHGTHFHQMTEAYIEQQCSGRPVHEWVI